MGLDARACAQKRGVPAGKIEYAPSDQNHFVAIMFACHCLALLGIA